jgi:hypothetical protein
VLNGELLGGSLFRSTQALVGSLQLPWISKPWFLLHQSLREPLHQRYQLWGALQSAVLQVLAAVSWLAAAQMRSAAIVLSLIAPLVLLACRQDDGPSAATPPPVGVTEIAQTCLPDASRPRGSFEGDVASGPFTLRIALYADPAIKSREEADHPSRASDVPGVGWRSTWTYHGPDTGPVSETWGLLTELGQDVPPSYDAIVDGQQGGRGGGGIVLPSDAKPGDRVGLGIRLGTAEGVYGAALFFTITKRAEQLLACRVAVSGWPPPGASEGS